MPIKTRNISKIFILFLIFTFYFSLFSLLFSQVVYEPIHNDIYNYLSRLSQRGVIEYHDNIKPLQRKYLALKLIEADENIEQLTSLEKEELKFFREEFGREIKREVKKVVLNEPVRQNIGEDKSHLSLLTSHDSSRTTWFGKDQYSRIRLFSYEDKLFTVNLSPILGYSFGKIEDKKTTHFWNGLSFYGYLTNNIGFNFSFRDNREEGVNINRTKEFTPETGVIPSQRGSDFVEYSEVRANISVDWSWGSFTVGKDFMNWGYSNGGKLVLSDKAPSFPFIRLDIYPTDWLYFNYFHGWLASSVIDSSASYETDREGEYRTIYRKKFIASHTLVLKAFTGFDISLGESIVYSDQLQFLYLMPIMFYRLADHYLSENNNNAGDNSQFFFALSSRDHIPNTHLYATLFIDELALSDVADEEKQRNQLGFTFGGSVTDLPINNLTFSLEYTRINPFVYRHYIQTQTYESNNYIMGHWMNHNADQIFTSIKYRIIRGLQAKVWAQYIRKGEDGTVDDQYIRPSKPFLFGLRFNYTNWGIDINYEIIHELFASLTYRSFQTSQEQEEGSFVDTDKKEFFFSLNYGF